MFHMISELPPKHEAVLDHESLSLTEEELRIIRSQIKKNSQRINDFIYRMDLFLNREKYPPDVFFVQKLRKRVLVLMSENDTFRKVLWNYYQSENAATPVKKV